jgi:hypothetical protein
MNRARVLTRIGVAVVGVATVAVMGMLSGGSAASGSTPSPAVAAPPNGGPPPGAAPGQASPAAAATPLALNQQSPLEDQFVPITPCRIVNTQLGGGRFAANTTRNFVVSGTAGFPAQGGKSGGCGIPAYADAIAASMTANTPTVRGYMRAYPAGTAEPTATVLTYLVGPGNISGATLTIKPNASPALTITNHSGNTDLVIDVTGYYIPPIEGLIYTGSTATPTSDGYVYSGTPRLLSVTWLSLGIADVTIDRDVTYCTPIANAYYGDFYYANAKAFNGNKIRVYSWSIDPTTHATAFVNNYVYLTVLC